MMSVLEYAQDVNKSVNEILNLCKKINIPVTDEEDTLDEEAITELDNLIGSEPEDEEEQELLDEIDDQIIEKEKNKIENLVGNSKAKKTINNNQKNTKKDLAKKKKEMYKHKEKLISNAPAEDKNTVIYKINISCRI